MPASTPRGMEMTDEMTMSIVVPTRAFEMPPPDSPMGFGSDTRKSQFMTAMPFLTMK